MYFEKRGVIFLWFELILVTIMIIVVIPLFMLVDEFDYLLNFPWLTSTFVWLLQYSVSFGINNFVVARVGHYFIQITRVTSANNQLSTTTLTTGAATRATTGATIATTANTNITVTTNANKDSHKKDRIRPVSSNVTTIHIPNYSYNMIGSPLRLSIVTITIWLFEIIFLGVSYTNIFSNKFETQYLIRVSFIFLMFILCIVIIVIAAKYKVFQFKDYWFITMEFRKLGRMMIWFLIIGFLTALIGFITPFNIEKIIKSIYDAMTVSFYIGLIYINTSWVHKMNNRARQKTDLNEFVSIGKPHDKVGVELAIGHHRVHGSSVLSLKRLPSMSVTVSGDVNTAKYVRRLNHFWDETFDFENNYSNVRDEFMLFCDHCVRELNMENLLFWVTVIQLLQFLIENKFIDASNKANIMPLTKKFVTRHHIQDTLLIIELKKRFEENNKKKNNNKNQNSNKNESELDYKLFKQFYIDLYKLFLQRDYAPFELNISHELRLKFSQYYQSMKNESNIMTKEMFENFVWKDLRNTAMDMYALLFESFQRFIR